MKYFLIVYSYGSGGNFGTGNLGFKCKEYPNVYSIQKYVKEDNVVITNIIEQTEQQFTLFWKEDK